MPGLTRFNGHKEKNGKWRAGVVRVLDLSYTEKLVRREAKMMQQLLA